MGTLFLPLSKMSPIYATRRNKLRVRVIYGCTKSGIIWQVLIQISWKLALQSIFTQGIQKSTQESLKIKGKYLILPINPKFDNFKNDRLDDMSGAKKKLWPAEQYMKNHYDFQIQHTLKLWKTSRYPIAYLPFIPKSHQEKAYFS